MLGLPVDMISIVFSCISLVTSIIALYFSYKKSKWEMYDRRFKDYTTFNTLFINVRDHFLSGKEVDSNIWNNILSLKINANKIFGKDISNFIEEFNKKLIDARAYKVVIRGSKNPDRYEKESPLDKENYTNFLKYLGIADYHKLYAKYRIKI